MNSGAEAPSPGLEPQPYGRISQFSQRIGGNPSGRVRVHPGNLFRHGDGPPVQWPVPLADAAEGPVHGLFHEVPIVGRSPFDELKEGLILSITGRFVVHGQTGDHGKRRPFDKLPIAHRPLPDLLPGKGHLLEQSRHLVAHIPAVEVVHPSLRLRRSKLRRISHEAGKDTGFVKTRFPQPQRQTVIAADLSRESAEVGDGNPQRAFRADPEARHPGDVLRVSQSLETSDDLTVGRECLPESSRGYWLAGSLHLPGDLESIETSSVPGTDDLVRGETGRPPDRDPKCGYGVTQLRVPHRGASSLALNVAIILSAERGRGLTGLSSHTHRRE